MDLMLPVASWHPNPFNEKVGEVKCFEPVMQDETLSNYLIRIGWEHILYRPANIYIGPQAVPRELWEKTIPNERTHISCHAAAENGGDGNSDTGRTILSLAVMAAAVYTGNVVGAQSAWAGIAAGAAVSIGGQLLINQFYPIEQGETGKELDDVYNISGGSNSIRPFQPLPIVCGVVRMFPDMDEKPYTWYRNNEQYVSQTFNFGLGDLFIRRERLGDTNLSELSIGRLEHKSTTVRNVDTITGAVLTEELGWFTRTGPEDTTRIDVDLSGVLLESLDEGGYRGMDCEFEVEISETGANNWRTLEFERQIYTTIETFEERAYDPNEEDGNKPPGEGWELFTITYGEGGTDQFYERYTGNPNGSNDTYDFPEGAY